MRLEVSLRDFKVFFCDRTRLWTALMEEARRTLEGRSMTGTFSCRTWFASFRDGGLLLAVRLGAGEAGIRPDTVLSSSLPHLVTTGYRRLTAPRRSGSSADTLGDHSLAMVK